MKITNGTDFGIRIICDGIVTGIPMGESANIVSPSCKITVYSEKKTSTRVEEQIIKAFHNFYADITTSCTADLSGYPGSSEALITSVRKEFQARTEYEYFLIKCNGNTVKNVRHEVCGGDKVINDRKKFHSDYKAEKNVNSIFGFFDKAENFFADLAIILLMGILSLSVTKRIIPSLIFIGILFALYLILLLPFGGIRRILGRSSNELVQTFFKNRAEPDDLEYFIKHINKYCK